MKKQNYISMLVFKIVLIMIMLGLLVYKKPNSDYISIVVAIIMVLLVTSFIRWKNPNAYKQDERTRYISSKAVSLSWFISLILVTLLYWNEYIDLFLLTSNQIITTIFIKMVGSIILFRIYFFRIKQEWKPE